MTRTSCYSFVVVTVVTPVVVVIVVVHFLQTTFGTPALSKGSLITIRLNTYLCSCVLHLFLLLSFALFLSLSLAFVEALPFWKVLPLNDAILFLFFPVLNCIS